MSVCVSGTSTATGAVFLGRIVLCSVSCCEVTQQRNSDTGDTDAFSRSPHVHWIKCVPYSDWHSCLMFVFSPVLCSSCLVNRIIRLPRNTPSFLKKFRIKDRRSRRHRGLHKAAWKAGVRKISVFCIKTSGTYFHLGPFSRSSSAF